jgi:hypothetical protein
MLKKICFIDAAMFSTFFPEALVASLPCFVQLYRVCSFISNSDSDFVLGEMVMKFSDISSTKQDILYVILKMSLFLICCKDLNLLFISRITE